MSKPLELEKHQWQKIFTQIRNEYPTSIWAIRSNLKRKLGFVYREYKDWDDNIGKYGGWRKNCIMLDFYSEKHRTLFLMKYSDVINDKTDSNF